MTNLDIFRNALGEERIMNYLKAELRAKEITALYDIDGGVFTLIHKNGERTKYLYSIIGVAYVDYYGNHYYEEYEMSAFCIIRGLELGHVV